MTEILQALAQYSASQWIALATGLAYVILAVQQKALCWPFGIISCGLIAYDDFSVFQLYADGVLQIFYILFGFAGIYYWIFRNAPGTTLPVASWPWHRHLLPLVTTILISIPLAYILRTYTSAAYSFLDTLTTLLSLWATWLLVRKVLENWLYWIVIDAVYVGLFWQRGGGLIAVLYTVYLVIALWGYLSWLRSLRTSTNHSNSA